MRIAKKLMQMNGNYLLDTNIVIRLFAEDSEIIEKIKKSKEIFIPSIVIGELYYGAQKSKRKKKNIEKIDQLVEIADILSCDYITARQYGRIKRELKEKGTPIPENDIWIAAISFQYDLELISQDAHFKAIKGLKLESW